MHIKFIHFISAIVNIDIMGAQVQICAVPSRLTCSYLNSAELFSQISIIKLKLLHCIELDTKIKVCDLNEHPLIELCKNEIRRHI